MTKRKFSKHMKDNANAYGGLTIASALILLACAFGPGYLQRDYDRRAETRIERQFNAPDVQTPDAGAPQVSKQGVAESESAKNSTYDRQVEAIAGYCSRATRQAVEKSQGTRYSYLFKASAKLTAEQFLRSGYAVVWPSQKTKLGGAIKPGDILFKRYVAKNSRGVYYGHVGIYTGNDLVWENSSTTIGRLSGAKGYRSLSQYGFYSGSVDVIGRLPNPKRLVLDAPNRAPKLIASGELWEDDSPRGQAKTITVDPREVAKYLGKKATDNHAPLRATVSGLGYRITRVEYSQDRVTVSIAD